MMAELTTRAHSGDGGLPAIEVEHITKKYGNFTAVGSQNVIQSAAHFQPIGAGAIAWVTVYALFYCSTLLMLAVSVFSRRDFK